MAYFKLEYLSFYTQDNTSKYIANTIGEFTSQTAINAQNKSAEELKAAFSETCAYLQDFKFNQSNFCFCFDEKFSIQTHSQCSLTFSMMEYVLLNGQRFKNPFVSVLQPGSLVLLTTQDGEEYLLNIESRSLDISEINSKYTYTCADNFTYTLSKQETAYEIENNSEDEDYIGAKTVDWWAYKITQETKMPYKYLPLQWSYSKHGTNYPAALQDKASYIKPAESDTAHENYTLFQTTAFSGSGSANSILISLAELYGLMIKTKVIFDRSAGTIDYYYWFETMKNSNWTGLSYTLDSTVSNFSISEKMDSFGTILNVTGGTIGDDQVTLLPAITPFFSNLFLSQQWTKENFYQNYFTSVVEYGPELTDTTTSNWKYRKAYNLNGVSTSGFLSMPYTLENSGGYTYLRCLNEKFNKYSEMETVQQGLTVSSRVNDYYIVIPDAPMAYEEHEEIPAQYRTSSFQVFIPCTVSTKAEDSSPYAVNFYCQWMRNPTEEDLAYAQAADRCPWLENRLIDFSYYYDHNIINKATLTEMNNYLRQELRYINGKLAVYLNQYYNAVHKKTTVLADITNKLDLVGANFASTITNYYRTKGVTGDISTASSLYSTYADVFSTTNDFQSSIINYSDTISDYVNKFFDSQQRFLKNIKNFTDYFNEPYSANSDIQLTHHQYTIVNKDDNDGYSFTKPSYSLLNTSDLQTDYIDENYNPTIPVYQKLSGSSKYQRIEPSNIVTMSNINTTDGYEIYTPKYSAQDMSRIDGWNNTHTHYVRVKQSLSGADIVNSELTTEYLDFHTTTLKKAYAGGYWRLTVKGNVSGTLYYRGTSPITESEFKQATAGQTPLRQTRTATGTGDNQYLKVTETDIINYLFAGIIPHDEIKLDDYYVLDDDIKRSALDLVKYLFNNSVSSWTKAILGSTEMPTSSAPIDNVLQIQFLSLGNFNDLELDAITYSSIATAYFHSLPLSDLTIEVQNSTTTQASHYITASNYDQYYRFISSKWLWTEAYTAKNWWKAALTLSCSVISMGAYAIGSAITNNDGSMGRSGYCFEDIAATDVKATPTEDFVSMGSNYWSSFADGTKKYQGIYAMDQAATTPAFAWFDLALASIDATKRRNLMHLTSNQDADVTYTTANLQWVNSSYVLGTNRANIGVYVCTDITQYKFNNTKYEMEVGTNIAARTIRSLIADALDDLTSNDNFKTSTWVMDTTIINSLYRGCNFGTFSSTSYLGQTVIQAYQSYLQSLEPSDGYTHTYTCTVETSTSHPDTIKVVDKFVKIDAAEGRTQGEHTFYVLFFEKLTTEKYAAPTIPKIISPQDPNHNYVNKSYLTKTNIKTSILQAEAIKKALSVETQTGVFEMAVYTTTSEVTETNSYHGSTLEQQLRSSLNIDKDDNDTLLTMPEFYRKDANGEFYRVYSILQYQQQGVYINTMNRIFNTCTATKGELQDSLELIHFTRNDDNSYNTDKQTIPLAFDNNIAKINDTTYIQHKILNTLSFNDLTNGQVCYILGNQVDSILSSWGVSTSAKSTISDAIYELSALIETNLETYWTSAYNASLYCDYFIPENWTNYANSSTNYFYPYLFDFHNRQVGTITLPVPTIKARFIPEVTMINKPQQKLKKYTLKHYAGGKTDTIPSDIELLIDYNQDPSWAVTNTNLNETVQDKSRKLQSVFGFTADDLDEWYVVESGYANYYELVSGGTKWNEVIPLLSGTAATESRYDRINGLYAMTVDVLHNYYQSATTTQYEIYRKLQQEAWRTFYQKYAGLIVEQSYENTDALTSEQLYNFAYAQFKDISKPEYDFSATVVEAAKLKGYTGQELHIGDPIKIEMQDLMDLGRDNISLQQLLYISGISYSLRKDSSTELTLNTLKYNDKLAQKLAKLIK